MFPKPLNSPYEHVPKKCPELEKVLFELEPGQWHGSASEIVWAERIGESQYRILNVPFFAFGIAAEDVVIAHEKNGVLTFEGVARHAGHSTYRLICGADVPADTLQKKWMELEALGCTYEQGQGRLRAVDVPPEADISKVYAALEEGEREHIWDFEEGLCAHLLS